MSSIENFNKTLEQLLNTIIENYPSQKQAIESCYNFPITNTNDTYIKSFVENPYSEYN